MQRWEYWVKSIDMTERWTSRRREEERQKLLDQFNEAGQRGWELVSYQAMPVVGSLSQDIKTYTHVAIFKRPTA